MLNDGSGFKKVYLATGFTDLRRGIDGLARIRQCMYCAGNKMWKFFIRKDLCINKAAKTKCTNRWKKRTEKCRKRRNKGTNNHNDEIAQILWKWICEKRAEQRGLKKAKRAI